MAEPSTAFALILEVATESRGCRADGTHGGEELVSRTTQTLAPELDLELVVEVETVIGAIGIAPH